jgi:predicted phosphodiesterase
MRIAVLSDIHANLVALETVLAAVGPVDGVWHLGDVVGYGPEPDAVVERLAALDSIGVRGNHDLAATTGDGLEWFNPEARAAIEWTRARISDATRRWLVDQPETRVEMGFVLVHGSLRDPTWEYLVDADDAGPSLARLGDHGVERGLFGHTHLPTTFQLVDDGRIRTTRPAAGVELAFDDRPILANPGSVGQPRDGDPAAGAMILDLEADTATWQRVPYDVGAVQAAIRAAGLPERLAARLAWGR